MKSKKSRRADSLFMKKQALLEKRALEESQKLEEEKMNAGQPEEDEPLTSAKVTELVFFKKYDTYQALLEIFPATNLSSSDCFSKIILYVMRWFKKRLGEDVYARYPEIGFLKTDYPQPEQFQNFDIEKVKNIEGLNFLDLETSYSSSSKAWFYSLEEPDNGKEGRNLPGRTFKTEICVYKKERSVVIGIRESCREPEENEEDAFGFRPGFVRDLFIDPDFTIGEEGLKEEYAFSTTPVIVNGKSAEKCELVYNELIASKCRQMPILFIPGEFYEANNKEVDEKTASLLGYCHVLVWQNTCRKLFSQIMGNEEFAEVSEEGQLIFYRSNYMQEYPTGYFEPGAEELLSAIKSVAQHEPLRKLCDFRDYSFDPVQENLKDEAKRREDEAASRLRAYELSFLRQENGNLRRDNDCLQKANEQLKDENAKLDKEIVQSISKLAKQNEQILDMVAQLDEIKEAKRKIEAKNIQQEIMIRGAIQAERERTIPLLNIPEFGKDKKEKILSWIEEYYGDVLIIHPNARKSFESESRNIDWHRFCMMIHYLAGYTKHLNNGGVPSDPSAAREYDPEGAAYLVSMVNNGPGTLDMYRDKYTISYTGKNGNEEALLDLHLKFGKGMDSNMIRIYFHYSSDLKKAIIGYMPGHLPTRKDGH